MVGARMTGGVLLAADSQASWDNANRMMKDAKTCQLSDLLAVAYCGSSRLGQLLMFHLDELDDPPLGRDEHRWAVRDFIPYLRDVTEAAGHMHIHRNVEHLGDSAFLFAVRGRLFAVEEDFSVSEHRYAFDALGSGQETAIGAMRAHAGTSPGDPFSAARARKITEAGVLAATEFTNFVGGDITYVETSILTEDETAFIRSVARRR